MGKISRILSINAYSVGDMVGGALGQIVSLYFLVYLIGVVGMPAHLAGLVIMCGHIIDAITDTAMGIIVDRTRTRFGASRPYFLISAPLIFAGSVMLWGGGNIQGTAWQMLYFITALSLFTTATTIAIVPYEALLPKIAFTDKERGRYTNVRIIYSAITTLGAILLFEIFMQGRAFSPEYSTTFTTIGLVVGGVFSIPLIITFFGTKEKLISHRPPKQGLRQQLKIYWQILKWNKYRKYFGMRLLGIIIAQAISATQVIIILVIFGNLQLLSLSLIFIVMGVRGIAELIFFPINMLVMRRAGKHAPYYFCLPLLIVALVIGLTFSATTPLWLFLVAVGFLGAGGSCLIMVPMALLPDLADEDERVSGMRREGMHAGLNALGSKLVAAATVAIIGLVLGAVNLGGENIQYVYATPQMFWALRIIFGGLPLVAVGGLYMITVRYNL